MGLVLEERPLDSSLDAAAAVVVVVVVVVADDDEYCG